MAVKVDTQKEVICQTISTTNASVTSSLCLTIRWANTVTCSASSDPGRPLSSELSPQGKAFIWYILKLNFYKSLIF